jgi:ferredoxin
LQEFLRFKGNMETTNNKKKILRDVIRIDEEKCDGCGLCVNACVEGAIQLVNGKAKLVSESYCDGLGACIGHCPQDAITIEKREAFAFDEQATKAHQEKQQRAKEQTNFVCPGVGAKQFERQDDTSDTDETSVPSQLHHWPVQLKLVSATAPYFANADLLLVADCVPFAMGDFHNRFLKGHGVAVGCPKLDDVQFYVEKLAAILQANKLNSLTVVHMEVPCCSGLIYIAHEAIARSGCEMSFGDVTIDVCGDVTKKETIEVSDGSKSTGK